MGFIVVIEDSPTQAQHIAAHLTELGFTVTIAYDGVEGLQMIDEIMPDVVVLDVHLPSMNGVQICRRLKRDPRLMHIPIIMLTAADGSDDILQGLDAGADDYIPKDDYAFVNLTATLQAAGLIP